jgi:hypothetical protein
LRAEPFRGLLLATALAASGIAFHVLTFRNPLGHYDRVRLPGFDAYVYVAMADHPAFFTLPPWGYRILTPWVVRALPVDPAEGYLISGALALGLAGVLLFALLRRLGVSEPISLLGTALFAFSPPVAEAVRFRFLSEPLTVLLEVALLLALEAAPSVGLLALIFVLGVLAKEEFLLFLPVLLFARRGREGLLLALGAGGPALLAFWILRSYWAPLAPIPEPSPSLSGLLLGASRILGQWREWVPGTLVPGLVLFAALGVATARGRTFLVRYGFVGLVAVGVAFAASLYTRDTDVVPFFPTDIPRLLLYALPVAIPAGLLTLEPGGASLLRPSVRLGIPALVLAVLMAAAPALTQDRYRRADLRGPKDGRYLLAFCRQTLAMADRLAKGRPVSYDVDARAFASLGSDPAFLERMRWFLKDGWGNRPQYGTGPAVMEEARASLVLPCFDPAPWALVLTLSAAEPTPLRVALNGHPLGEVQVGAEPERDKIQVGPGDLFRGDNLIEFEGRPGVRLHDLAIHPEH